MPPTRIKLLPFIYSLALLLTSCADREKITVVDGTGAPVAGARVAIQKMSTDGTAHQQTWIVLTSAEGTTQASRNVTGVHWVAVSKPGYQTVQLHHLARWPLRVVLRQTK